MRRSLAGALAVITLLVACNDSDEDQVIARVSGREVEKSAVERELKWLAGRAGRSFPPQARSTRLARGSISRRLVIREVLERRVSEIGPQPTSDQIDRVLVRWEAVPEFEIEKGQREAYEAEARETLLWEILIVYGTRGVPPANRYRRNRQLHDAVVREAASAWYASGYEPQHQGRELGATRKAP